MNDYTLSFRGDVITHPYRNQSDPLFHLIKYQEDTGNLVKVCINIGPTCINQQVKDINGMRYIFTNNGDDGSYFDCASNKVYVCEDTAFPVVDLKA